MEENTSEFLYNLEAGKTFPTMTQNSEEFKEKTDYVDYLNIDNFHVAK